MTDQQQGGNLAGFGLEDREAKEPVWHIPAGDYLVAAVSSGVKQNKAKTGTYLEVALQVLEGEHKGFKLSARFNLKNASSKAVEIGLDQLKLFCVACGVPSPNDSSDLHNIPVVVSVKVKNGTEPGQFFNEVKGFKSREEAAKGQQSPTEKPSFMQ